MAREVLTLKDIKFLNESAKVARGVPADSSVPANKDEYFDRLLKYIPAEVVACYIFVMGLIQKLPAGSPEIKVIHWIVFVLFCVITFFYLWKPLNVRKIQQLTISIVAFIVWVFALGGPFALYAWYNPIYGEILLPIYTLVAAIWAAENN
jgi:hypothetical protein